MGQQPPAQGKSHDRFEYPFIFLDLVEHLCGVRIEFKARTAGPTGSDTEDHSSSISEAERDDSYDYISFADQETQPYRGMSAARMYQWFELIRTNMSNDEEYQHEKRLRETTAQLMT